jgi:protocatechuate 3,4-dioxygenase beta subunit
VLLADVLGVSTLLEDLNAPRPPGATPNTLAGPFYRPDMPDLPNGADLSRDGKGEPLRVTGRVQDLDGRPVGGAPVEIWHANAEGLTRIRTPTASPSSTCGVASAPTPRAASRSAPSAPAARACPRTAPVGRLLQQLGLGLERPAHLHIRVAAPGFDPLVTHVFDRDDPLGGSDPIFAVKPGLLTRSTSRATTGRGARIST